MPSQRFILGAGLAVLLSITAASMGLDLKSRTEAAWVDQRIGALKGLADFRLLVRHAESAGRGFALTGDPNLMQEYRDLHASILPALAELKEILKDNPDQSRLLERSEPLVIRRFALGDELLRLRETGNDAGAAALTAKAEGGALMKKIGANFDAMISEEKRLLALGTTEAQRTRDVLLLIDLAGAVLILMLAAVLTREARRASRELERSLRATEAARESLEAAVAERTSHLQAAHEGLRHSSAILRNTFESMSEAVLVIDTKGEILLSNPAAERLLHYRPGMNSDQLRTQNIAYQADGTTPLPGRDRPVERAMRGEKFEGYEVVFRHPDGREPHHVVAGSRPLLDASGAVSGAALVYHDVTAARDTERKLQQSQKLDAIGKLTGGVAHDFNNMLTVITGNTEMLVAGLKDRPDLQRTAAQIDQAADRCAELIQHLLAFARKQPLQPRNVDINDAILDIAKLLRPTLGEQIEIESVFADETCFASVDPNQLTTAILNLALNARDAMQGGGKLIIETGSAYLDETYASRHGDVRPGHYALIAVSDTGSGIPASILDKVFEPFFTLKEPGKGTGLGLSMVYGFVKQSSGHIKIYSEVGHGTTIKMYLPPGTAAVPASEAAPDPKLQGGHETILVVEDDRLVREYVLTQLHSLGYATLDAANGAEALAIVEAGRPFDLLFTDVIMPGAMNGRQLAEEILRRRPGSKVLYTSGYTENAIIHHGRLDSDVLLLAKPYRKSDMARMIRRAVAG